MAEVGLVLQAEVLVVVQAPANTEIKLRDFGTTTAASLGKFKANKMIKKKTSRSLREKMMGGILRVRPSLT